MRTHIVEVTNGPNNWGKFLIGQFDHEWEHTSAVDLGRRLLPAIGWGPGSAYTLVVDLQTGEGAIFLLGGLASADLQKHKIWVCPMFEPFLEWLYTRWREAHDQASLYKAVRAGDPRPDFWEALPVLVDLPDASFAMSGYRRTGQAE
jgi:hypothetical protein